MVIGKGGSEIEKLRIQCEKQLKSRLSSTSLR